MGCRSCVTRNSLSVKLFMLVYAMQEAYSEMILADALGEEVRHLGGRVYLYISTASALLPCQPHFVLPQTYANSRSTSHPACSLEFFVGHGHVHGHPECLLSGAMADCRDEYACFGSCGLYESKAERPKLQPLCSGCFRSSRQRSASRRLTTFLHLESLKAVTAF